MTLLRTPSEAIEWANRQQTWAPHSCLNFVKNAYYGDRPTQNSLDGKPYLWNAVDGWNNSEYKHPGDLNVPDGALMYFAGAHPGDPGDVQIKTPGNMSRRTDVGQWGRVGTTPMMWMQDVVGRKYLGWTEDVLGYHVFASGAASPIHTNPTTTPTHAKDDDDMAEKLYKESGGRGRVLGGSNGVIFTFGSAKSLAVFVKNKPDVVTVSTDTFDKLYKKR